MEPVPPQSGTRPGAAAVGDSVVEPVTPPLRRGDKVRIRDLASRPELNGVVATLGHRDGAERWRVKTPDKQVFAILRSNLDPLPLPKKRDREPPPPARLSLCGYQPSERARAPLRRKTSLADFVPAGRGPPDAAASGGRGEEPCLAGAGGPAGGAGGARGREAGGVALTPHTHAHNTARAPFPHPPGTLPAPSRHPPRPSPSRRAPLHAAAAPLHGRPRPDRMAPPKIRAVDPPAAQERRPSSPRRSEPPAPPPPWRPQRPRLQRRSGAWASPGREWGRWRGRRRRARGRRKRGRRTMRRRTWRRRRSAGTSSPISSGSAAARRRRRMGREDVPRRAAPRPHTRAARLLLRRARAGAGPRAGRAAAVRRRGRGPPLRGEHSRRRRPLDGGRRRLAAVLRGGS
ncbi:hypothetical protein EMIHUDRAFT_445089 [Emiliania huxleyi CCMP1516]|uniref:Uncharacterized protein n=2 Tax=Emiliania huxleyi TaxID=2903 RepID=A0A0D3J599_EMIH1|nr:hypothetical protein EMIHUDRAFT_445089 [Emiliania huxleyi CCMP1516]EOD18684.1 hypothetical protein EMIHUDRAFT_445089 [Emiliania huxleyi CCMP1516]|eukprot:XP_005771113.1 hypothetical protein EMIHUDRAFT_445089 [Emiliania huxleyi CCMP1516]